MGSTSPRGSRRWPSRAGSCVARNVHDQVKDKLALASSRPAGTGSRTSPSRSRSGAWCSAGRGRTARRRSLRTVGRGSRGPGVPILARGRCGGLWWFDLARPRRSGARRHSPGSLRSRCCRSTISAATAEELLRRRDDRGPDHRPRQGLRPGRHRPQLRVRLQGPARRRRRKSPASSASATSSRAASAGPATGSASMRSSSTRPPVVTFGQTGRPQRRGRLRRPGRGDRAHRRGARGGADARPSRPGWRGLPTTNLEAYDYFLRAEQAAKCGHHRAPARRSPCTSGRRHSIPPSPTPSQPRRGRRSTSGATTSTSRCRHLWRAKPPTRWPVVPSS